VDKEERLTWVGRKGAWKAVTYAGEVSQEEGEDGRIRRVRHRSA
jgi:hypothetical protein